MRYRSVLTLVVLCLLVGASGCSGILGGADAAEIRDRATTAMQDVSAYNFTMDVDLEGESQSFSWSMQGTIDVEDQAMYMTLNGGGSDAVQYLVDDTLYTRVSGQWRQQTIEQDVWNRQRQLEQHRQIFENAEVSLVGETTVDGENVVEISLEPDPADVEDIFQQSQGQSGATQMSIDDVSYTVYVRQSDYLPKRVDANASRMTPQGQQIDATMVMTFSEYGTDPELQVPQEALDAQQAPSA